jgi:phosphopantothenoylcysteine decarboxylase/phosphopantothenate--cysteine ligase
MTESAMTDCGTDQRRVAVVTGGGTREPLDDVRYLSNVATGTLPAAIAEALLARGWQVHYLHGPGAVLPGRATLQLELGNDLDDRLAALGRELPRRAQRLAAGELHLVPAQTAVEVADRLEVLCRSLQPALVVCAMAVADYAPEPQTGKLSSQLGEWVVRMRPTPKAIDRVKAAAPHCRLLGFKLLAGATPEELTTAARRLAQRSQADWVFANDLSDYGNQRRGRLLAADGQSLVELQGSPADLAEALADAVCKRL